MKQCVASLYILDERRQSVSGGIRVHQPVDRSHTRRHLPEDASGAKQLGTSRPGILVLQHGVVACEGRLGVRHRVQVLEHELVQKQRAIGEVEYAHIVTIKRLLGATPLARSVIRRHLQGSMAS